MPSNINTDALNANYPVPGVDNTSQGFRDNFANIKNNLDAASTEISDLQNKADNSNFIFDHLNDTLKL